MAGAIADTPGEYEQAIGYHGQAIFLSGILWLLNLDSALEPA